MHQTKMTDYYTYNSKIVNYINSWYKYLFSNSKNVDENSIKSSVKQSRMTDYYRMIDKV